MAKKKALAKEEVATCPACGAKYPERDYATEPTYECVDCGSEGFDCCVPGKNSRCEDCEAKAEE